jgi:peptidoglycan/LPS O-acetylase OafA/YrhL
MAFLTPLIGWGFIAAILTWNQSHEQLNSNWLVKAGKDSFGAYLIHIPILAGVMVIFYSLGIKNIWIIGMGSTAIAIVLSFSTSHQLRRIPIIKSII